MTEGCLVYTNLLIYAPVASPHGVIRMEEAVIPIECHYERSVFPFIFNKVHIQRLSIFFTLLKTCFVF